MSLLPLVVRRSLAIAASLVATHALPADTLADEVNVYSYRQPFLLKPLLKRFTEKSDVNVNVVYADKGLVERMALEGELSPADVLLTADVARLHRAAQRGLAQAIDSTALRRIPKAYRDENGRWFAITLRARVAYLSRHRTSETELSYDDFADPRWRGKICTRSGQHPYNLGLIASRIAHVGEDAAREWLKGVRDNLARRPSGNDRAQAKGVFSGVCDLAIANTYYMGVMINNHADPIQKEWANAVRIVFPDGKRRGAHVNVSGMMMAKHAPNPKQAMQLMEFLVSDEGQALYAEQNYEYPVIADVKPSKEAVALGEFRRDPLPLTEIARLYERAGRLVDEVQFNQ